MRNRYLTIVLFLAALVAMGPAALAQSIGSASCESYKNAKDLAQQAPYLAYLQGYANASSPDPRYTQSEAALNDDAKKVRDWCDKNSKRTYAEAVAGVLGSASANCGSPAAQASLEPTACKAGPSQYCGGCSITCNGGKQATCKQGTDNAFGNPTCTFEAKCYCK